MISARKILFIILFSTIFVFQSKAQGFAFYPFTGIFSMSSNPTKSIWLDVRFQTNSSVSSLSTEISPMITLKNSAVASYYIGGGVKFNALNSLANEEILEGYMANVGVRTFPFEKKIKNAQLIFELSPYANKDFSIGNLRANLGIGYVFK